MKKAAKISLITLAAAVPAAGIATTIALICVKKNSGTIVVTENDKKLVNTINTNIGSKTFNTMSDLIAYLNTDEGGNIDLPSQTLETNNVQIVWDSNDQSVFLMKDDGSIAYASDEYTINENKNQLWKMVKAGSSTQLFAAKNSSIHADAFSSGCLYSQYLRDGFTENSQLNFISGIDTGNNKKLSLKLENLTKNDTPIVINTLVSSLIIDSQTEVHHYGNLSELTVKLADKTTALEEYGSVDAAIKLESGTINAQKDSSVNSVVITSKSIDNVQVNVEKDGYIGSVGATENEVVAKIDSLVTVDDEAKVEKQEIVKEQAVEEPSTENTFYSGDGTELSPYTIKTKTQLDNFAEHVKNNPDATHYFNLVADIDYSDEQHNPGEWTPVGSQDHPFKGWFNGCGFTIKNIKYVYPSESNIEPRENHVGFFANTLGDKNTSYDITETLEDKCIDKVWDSTDNKIIETNITEEKYTTAIENLTLENVNSVDNEKYFVGGIAGASEHTYFYNCHVKSGTISGQKHVGGIAGTMGGCVCKDCSVGDDTNDLTITATAYHVGGIAGSTGYQKDGWPIVTAYSCFAFLNCSTGSKCKINVTNCTGGSVGGLVGDNQGAKCCVYDSCTNNATIEVNGQPQYVGGIAAFGQNVGVFSNCTNNAPITVTSDSGAQFIGGITSMTNGPTLYKCTNTAKGVLTGYCTVGMAGIAAGCNFYGDKPPQSDTCENKGALHNLNESETSTTAQIWFFHAWTE